ncbi:uncharacterized protein C3orf20 [Xenopus laevis]|nr:uncharacterized protein C3orf20 [Xenopus laevis]
MKVRLSLSPLVDVSVPQLEDLGILVTNESFSSRTAREMCKANRKKAKEKETKKNPSKSKSILAELAKTLEIPEAHVSPLNDFSAVTELRRLQRKIRNIVDDWMEHYRLASGIDSPHIQKMSETPIKMSRKRKVQSAAVLPVTSMTDPKEQQTRDTEGAETHYKDIPLPHGRFLSAPAQSNFMRLDTPLSFHSPRPSSSKKSTVKQEHSTTEGSLYKSVSGMHTLNKSGTPSASLAPLSPEQDLERLWRISHHTCPIVLQRLILGEEGGMCRCSNHQIPNITDLEYDKLINMKVLPTEQILVVCVVSSGNSEEDQSTDVLNLLYERKNKYRSMPCMQSRLDSFRLLKYDINSCTEFTGFKDPLLVHRHNVAPGMFLMYFRGKLLFANYIFNGYSRSAKDLQKQIVKSRSDYQMGYSLPCDFKFSNEGHMHLSSLHTGQDSLRT